MSKQAEIANDRAIEYWKRNRFGEAIAQWEEALRMNPRVAEIYHNLGNAYAHQKLPDKAIESLKQALSLDPTLVEAYNKLGCIFYDQGNREMAISSWNQALEVDPDFGEALHNLHLAESTPQFDVNSEIPEYEHGDSEESDENQSWFTRVGQRFGRIFGGGAKTDAD